MMGPFGHRKVVGLTLGGASSAAVLARRGKRGELIKPLRVAEAAPVRFQGGAPDDLDAIVKSLAAKLGREARRADTPTAIALPDPLFSEDRFSFAEVPDKPAALNALIKWRIAREHRLNADDIAASCQRLPSKGEPEFLVRFTQKAIIDGVETAARRAGLTPTLIEAQSRFQAPVDAGPATAVIIVSDQWWTLIYRDASTPEGHVRSDWREGDLMDLSASLIRLIRTMSRTQSGLAVTINAAEAEATSLIEGMRVGMADDCSIELALAGDDSAVALQAAAA